MFERLWQRFRRTRPSPNDIDAGVEAWTPVDPPRPLDEWESAIVARLAPAAPREAIGTVRVVGRCTCGCSSIGFSQVDHVLVAEAEDTDEDGTPIWVMLFADRDETMLATLDVLRADSWSIEQIPDPALLSVSRAAKWRGE